MSEGIKKLIECEKRGKDRINEAMNAQNELRRRITKENEFKREKIRCKYQDIMRKTEKEYEEEMKRAREEMDCKKKECENAIDELSESEIVESIVDMVTLKKAVL